MNQYNNYFLKMDSYAWSVSSWLAASRKFTLGSFLLELYMQKYLFKLESF